MKKKLAAIAALAIVFGAIVSTTPAASQTASAVPPDPIASYNTTY